MTAFTITRRVGLDVDQAWARLTDFAAHGDVVPATSITLDDGEIGPGWGFSAVTGVGRIGFADHMIVTIFDPPSTGEPWGRFRIVKIGAWLRGWAEVSVTGLPGGGTLVTWTEELGPRLDPLPRLTAPVAARAGRALFGRTLDRLLDPTRP